MNKLHIMATSDTILFADISKICRVCLAESETMRSLHSKLDENQALEVKVENISEVLTRITNVTVTPNDGFPDLICTNCLSLLHGAYKFKVQFDHSHNILLQYMLDCIKEETQSISSVIDCIENDAKDFDYDPSLAEQNVENSGNGQEISQEQIQNCQENAPVEIRRARKKNKKLKVNLRQSILHSCPVCTKEFNALDLREHVHTHKSLKRYLSIPTRFNITPKTRFYKEFNSQTTVGEHNRTVKLHKCVSCDSQLDYSASYLRFHLQTHQTQTEYRCDQCKRVFRAKHQLSIHKRLKHLKKYPFTCDQCGKGYVVKTNYDCHMLTHKTDQEQPHGCSYCLKQFSNPEQLHRHMVIHTENISYCDKYKTYKCRYCFKTFKDDAELKAHDCVPIEQAANDVCCKICNKAFKNSRGLYNHNRRNHQLKGEKVLCSVCGKYVWKIDVHMLSHSGEKPFQCKECGKTFAGSRNLRQHQLIHTGLKPFVCSVCGKAFSRLYSLQVHERIHVGDRCHVCGICGKGFLEDSYLKKHMNVHTKHVKS